MARDEGRTMVGWLLQEHVVGSPLTAMLERYLENQHVLLRAAARGNEDLERLTVSLRQRIDAVEQMVEQFGARLRDIEVGATDAQIRELVARLHDLEAKIGGFKDQLKDVEQQVTVHRRTQAHKDSEGIEASLRLGRKYAWSWRGEAGLTWTLQVELQGSRFLGIHTYKNLTVRYEAFIGPHARAAVQTIRLERPQPPWHSYFEVPEWFSVEVNEPHGPARVRWPGHEVAAQPCNFER